MVENAVVAYAAASLRVPLCRDTASPNFLSATARSEEGSETKAWTFQPDFARHLTTAFPWEPVARMTRAVLDIVKLRYGNKIESVCEAGQYKMTEIRMLILFLTAGEASFIASVPWSSAPQTEEIRTYTDGDPHCRTLFLKLRGSPHSSTAQFIDGQEDQHELRPGYSMLSYWQQGDVRLPAADWSTCSLQMQAPPISRLSE